MEENPYSPPKSDPSNIIAETLDSADFELATRWSRFAGSLLDGIILIVPIVGIVFVFDYYLGEAYYDDPQTVMLTEAISGVVIVLIWVLINVRSIVRNGQTIGKMAVGIKVVRDDGSPIGGSRYVFARFLPIYALSYAPMVGGIIGLIDALLIFRESRKCLHDDIAGTIVIKTK